MFTRQIRAKHPQYEQYEKSYEQKPRVQHRSGERNQYSHPLRDQSPPINPEQDANFVTPYDRPSRQYYIVPRTVSDSQSLHPSGASLHQQNTE